MCPDDHVKDTTPKLCTHVVPAYSKVPAAMVFENDYGRLFIAGYDRCVKMWDSTTSELTLKRKYKGCHGLVILASHVMTITLSQLTTLMHFMFGMLVQICKTNSINI